MMKPERAHPFHVYEWITSREIKPIWDNMMIQNVHGDPVPRCCPNAHRHVHMDLSKNKDATGFCVGHVAGEMEVSRLDPETHEKRKEDAPLIHIDLCLRIIAPHAGESRAPFQSLTDMGIKSRESDTTRNRQRRENSDRGASGEQLASTVGSQRGPPARAMRG
ncbi:MAG: hypothetical protein IIC02_04895 [Planctomycetes bacterium]|nr:hypothetical protein [Planctomycetota bacterium]